VAKAGGAGHDRHTEASSCRRSSRSRSRPTRRLSRRSSRPDLSARCLGAGEAAAGQCTIHALSRALAQSGWWRVILPESPSADRPVRRLRIGDHLVSPRRFTSHHGICVGNGQVIHYAGLASGLQAGPVKSRPCKSSSQTIPTRSGSTRRGRTRGKNPSRGYGHASGRTYITWLSITASTS
jgi:Lecithin retinol acyltransferase